ncbi:hypothetical protein [Escherichia coli]|uniref:hypothetical protein n=1 Tax=Escherichia coli TaxID=562 RepID=UPI000E20E29D|nr:hypothetical protein [Escherichia coli]
MTRVTVDTVLAIFKEEFIQREVEFSSLPHGTIFHTSVEGFDLFREWLDENHDVAGTVRFRNRGHVEHGQFSIRVEVRSDKKDAILLCKLAHGGI